MPPIAVDLFCGAGGMSEGLIQAGFHIVFSSDINEQVEKTYKNRHNQLGLIQGYNTHFERIDVRELSGEFIINTVKELEVFKNRADKLTIDAIFGGPPCQGFSRAGKRDPNDPRNMLFKEYVRVVNEIRPSYVVMENVEGFMDMVLYDFQGLDGRYYDGGNRIVNILLNEFTEIGYETLEPRLLDASDFGVPQRRNRAIFIAHLPNKAQPEYPLATLNENEKVSILDAIGDLIRNPQTRRRYNNGLTDYQIQSREGRTPNIHGQPIMGTPQFKNNDLSNHSNLIVERFSLYNRGEDTSALRRRIIRAGIDLENHPHLTELVLNQIGGKLSREELIETFRDGNVDPNLVEILLTKKNNRVKLNHEIQSPTVLTLPDDFISPFEDRIFSVRELARLQSFDDSFEFLGKRTTGGDRRKFEVPQYTQVGNAVPPLLSKAIALQIRRAIEEA